MMAMRWVWSQGICQLTCMRLLHESAAEVRVVLTTAVTAVLSEGSQSSGGVVFWLVCVDM